VLTDLQSLLDCQQNSSLCHTHTLTHSRGPSLPTLLALSRGLSSPHPHTQQRDTEANASDKCPRPCERLLPWPVSTGACRKEVISSWLWPAFPALFAATSAARGPGVLCLHSPLKNFKKKVDYHERWTKRACCVVAS